MIVGVLALIVRSAAATDAAGSDAEIEDVYHDPHTTAQRRHAALRQAVEEQVRAREGGEIVEVEVPDARSLASVLTAAREAASSKRLAPDSWIWINDDSGVPSPRALAELLACVPAAEPAADPAAAPVGIVGAKQRTPDGYLVNVGLTTTRAGRPLPGVEHEELDQGQRDHAGAVLAVSRQGMLIRREVLGRLSADDPTFEGVIADIDFCRRAHWAGYQVLVAPAAVVTRMSARLGTDASTAGGEVLPPEFRGQITHYRMVGEPAWKLPWVWVVSALGAVGRIVLGIAAADTLRGLKAAGSTMVALLNLQSILRGRKLQPRPDAAARRRVAALLASPEEARRYHRDRFGESRRMEQQESPPPRTDRANQDAPCHAVPIGEPARRRRNAWALPVVAAVTLLGVVACVNLFTTGQVTSAALPTMPANLTAMVRALAGSWRDVGLGQGGAADPILQPLTVLSILGGGHPSTAVKVILLTAPGAAAAIGWWLSASLRTSRGWRIVAALAWAATPAFLVSVTAGRLGAVLAHLGLGMSAAALICALGSRHRRASWAWAGVGALGAWLACTGAPVLALPVVLLLGGVALWSRRPHPLVMLLPAVIGVAPLWLTRPAAVFIEPGTSTGTGRFYAWMALFGWPEGPSAMVPEGLRHVGYLSGAVPLVLALVGLALGASARPGAVTTRFALAAALVGMVTATLTSFQPIGIDPAGSGMRLTYGWPAPGISLTTLGLLLVGLVAVPQSRALGRLAPRRDQAWSRRLAAAVVTGCAVPSVVGLAGWCWTMREHAPAGSIASARSRVPAAAAALAGSPDHTRILFVRATATGGDVSTGQTELARIRPRLSVLRGDGPRLDQTAASVTQEAVQRTKIQRFDPATAALDQAFVNVVLGNAPAASAFAPFGIGAIVVSGGPGSDILTGRLTGTSGLLEVGQVAGMRAFRVEAQSAGGINAPDRPAALRLVGPGSASGWQALDWNQSRRGAVTTVVPAHPSTATLLTSMRADRRWHVQLNGTALQPVTVGGWQQGFTVPAGQTGTVRLSYDDPLTTVWLVVLVLTLGCVTLLAAPLRGARG